MSAVTIEKLSTAHGENAVALILPIQQLEFGVPITVEDQPDLLNIDGFYNAPGGGFWGAVKNGGAGPGRDPNGAGSEEPTGRAVVVDGQGSATSEDQLCGATAVGCQGSATSEDPSGRAAAASSEAPTAELVGTIALINVGHDTGVIRKMFVKKEYRGKELGVAQQLIEKLLAESRTRGIKHLYLGTIERMKAAQRFYERNGFEKIDPSELPPYFPRMAPDNVFYHLTLQP